MAARAITHFLVGRPPISRRVVLAVAGWAVAAASASAAGDRKKGQTQSPPPKAGPPPAVPSSGLPAPVEEMRAMILAAARTGDIAQLRTALEWNELKPEIGAPATTDPIAHWTSLSADGRGIEILAVLTLLLEGAPAIVEAGKPGERYVWPAIAERPLVALTLAEEVELYRLLRPAEAAAARTAARWPWWRLVIGRDGTWHGFVRGRAQ